jgi:hypothetical protein
VASDDAGREPRDGDRPAGGCGRAVGDTRTVEQHRFTYDEAAAILPEARRRVGVLADHVAAFEHLGRQIAAQRSGPGAVAEAKALEARVDEELDWFRARGVQVKGLAPPLLDFPADARLGGEDVEVLLCWQAGEDGIAWFHPTGTGFASRTPLAVLDEV